MSRCSRSTVRRLRASTAVLAVALLAPLPLAAPAAAVSGCADTRSRSDFYPGPSASKVYDSLFRTGPAIPSVDTYTPQGLATWRNWDGSGRDLLVLGSYRPGQRSRLYGIDPRTGRTVGAVSVAASHLGGLAIANGWLIAQHEQGYSNGSVRKYRLSALRKAMKAPGVAYLSHSGTQEVFSAEFMGAYGDHMWSGRYNVSGNGTMYQYRVGSDGQLSRVGGAIVVPPRTQGVLVTGSRFYFSASDGFGAGRMWVTPRTKDYRSAAGRCFRTPSMSEGIAASGGRAYVVYEGYAPAYRAKARNPIARLHSAGLGGLSNLG